MPDIERVLARREKLERDAEVEYRHRSKPGYTIQKLCKMVDAAIKDEDDAVQMYGEMAHLVEDGWKLGVNSIQQDEKKHAGMVREMKQRFCR